MHGCDRLQAKWITIIVAARRARGVHPPEAGRGNVDFMGLSRRRTLLRRPVSPLCCYHNHNRMITPLQGGHEGINRRDAMENPRIAYRLEDSEGDSGRGFRSLAGLPSWFPTDSTLALHSSFLVGFQALIFLYGFDFLLRGEQKQQKTTGKGLMYLLGHFDGLVVNRSCLLRTRDVASRMGQAPQWTLELH